MRKIYRPILSVIVALFIAFAPLTSMLAPVYAQGSGCMDSTPSSGAYTVTVCFSEPSDGSTLTGDSNVTVTISITGTSPGVQRVIFYLDGTYLLTDYQGAYTFALPTAKWVDGTHTLSVEALMRDAFVTQQASISVSFNNGITSPPVNTNQFQPSVGTPPVNGAPFIVAASGDGASGESNATNVANLLDSLNPNLFLYLGDVYEKGSVAEFYNWYGTSTNNFGKLRSITDPTIGNHEYENGVAPGYFDYWDNVPNYYSYDAGGWHFISLNSNSAFEPVDPQSAQYQWLQQDLAAHPQACTIAYYHHPLFNIGAEAPKTSMSDIWALMAQYGVSIVINGHDHDYQRWVPLDANGQPSPSGITEFVAGGAGHGLQTFTTTDSRVAYSNDLNPTAFGVLLLQLNSDGANFSYVNTAGDILDSGVIPCVNAGSDSQPPSVPDALSATVKSATQVDLNWSASSDNTGVSGYTIYRDGTAIATVPGSSLTYSDLTAQPQTTYQYQADAFDPAGNYSALSSPVSVTTPSMAPTLTFQVEADTYVNAGSPTSKYGSATAIRVDGSPDLHSYLRFTVQGLAGYPIANVSLQVYANNSTSIGIDAHSVADNSWDELNTTYDNAPALGNILASSGAYLSGNWVTLDVTSDVTGEGTYSFGLTTTGLSTLSFASRESGANAAQLVVTFQDPNLDTQPPTVPDGFTAAAVNASQVDLAWNASTDNVAVTGYTVYRDGNPLATVPDTNLAYSDVTASPNTTYQYSVDAFDAAGNHSAASTPISVTTPDIPSSLTFTPEADTYVNASSSASNYGYSTSLRVDASPDVHSYMRFNLIGSGGAPVTRARLFIYANSSSSADILVQSVADNSWDEYTMTYDNAPALGGTLGSISPITGGTWLEFDVTPYITGDGLFSFGVSTSGATLISLASRESGADAPQLIVDYQNSGPDTEAPEIPTGLTANASASTQVDLSWNASSDNVGVAGYTIYRDGTSIASVSGATLSYSDTTTSSATTYAYSVDAFDAAGNHSAASTPVSVTTPDDQPPSVPTGLSANVISSTQVDLSWNASTDNVAVTGYTIYRDGVVLATLPDTSLTYSDTSVLSGLTYSYTIDAFDAAGNHSAASTPVGATTPDDQPPSVPTGLTANASSATQVDLNWVAATDNVAVSGYTIYRDGVALATVPDTSLSYSDTTAVSNTTYQYSVDAFDTAGNHSAASTPVSVTTPDNQPPSTPTGLSANVVSSTQVDLSWNASTDNIAVAGYTVYRDGVMLTTLPDTNLSYSDTSVLPGVTYSYTVDAFDQDGNHSAASDPVSVTTPDTEPPTTPTSLAANASGPTQVDLNWGAATDNVAVAGYTIFRDGSTLATVPYTSLSFSDTTASPATTYQYSVDAFDAAGNHSVASSLVSATTPSIPSTLTFTPEADSYVNANSPTSNYGTATSLRADASPDLHSYLRFNVQGSGGAPVSRARLFIYANSNSSMGLNLQAVADNSWDELTINYNNAPALGALLGSVPSVSNGTWLEIDVTSYVTGDGLFSFGIKTPDTRSIRLSSRETGANAPQLIVDLLNGGPDTQAPGIPTGLTANTPSSTQVDLSWDASTDNVGVAGYTVYRDGVAIATVAGTSLSYSDATVSPTTTYQYSVDAFDAAGNHSAASAPVSVTTPNNPPSVPTGLSANLSSSTQVDLSWNASTDDVAVAGYTIYRDGNVLATVPDTSLTYSDTTVMEGTSYSYTVDAFDQDGNHSAASDPVAVTIPDTLPPDTPTGLTAIASSSTQADLSWNASTDNVAVAGYTIYRDGATIATVSGSTLTYSDTTVTPATTYQYSVDAFDAAGNHSAASGTVSVITPDMPLSLIFTPVADTYVNAGSPSSNYGYATSLRADGSPDVHSYLRFDVQGLNGKSVVQARLSLYFTSKANKGIDLFAVADNSWDEYTVTYNTAPALGSNLASSGQVKAAGWVTLDVTLYLTGEGTYSFGITTSSSTALSIASRESGANAPQLIIDLQ